MLPATPAAAAPARKSLLGALLGRRQADKE
jgi:hypothetical protein